MLGYIIRRILYTVPVVLGVSVIVFLLFFTVTTPESMARQILGDKNTTQEAIDDWLEFRGYDRPTLWNAEESGLGKVTDTIFWQKTIPLLYFDFGRSDRDDRPIGRDIAQRIMPSLSIAVPMFIGMVISSVIIAMFVAHYRGTYLDMFVLVVCVILMSISELFYIIGGQYIVASKWNLTPVSGYEGGLSSIRFVLMPFIIGILVRLGAEVRFNRTVFLEEVNRDYVRTARAKGLGENSVLFGHVLKNAMIPILTGAVLTLPLLILGSILLENFFAIPGLGSYLIDAINAKDFAIVRAMVFLYSLLYIVGLLLTDISYTLVDPRVRLE